MLNDYKYFMEILVRTDLHSIGRYCWLRHMSGERAERNDFVHSPEVVDAKICMYEY